jgi:hypothetical protein
LPTLRFCAVLDIFIFFRLVSKNKRSGQMPGSTAFLCDLLERRGRRACSSLKNIAARWCAKWRMLPRAASII